MITNIARRVKRDLLVKELVKDLAIKFIGKQAEKLIAVKINEKISTCCYHTKIIKSGKYIHIGVSLNLKQIRDLCKKPYSPYYPNRDNIIKPFKYKKALLRHAILHELYHAKSRLKRKNNDNKKRKFEELQADRFAIDRVKALGFKEKQF